MSDKKSILIREYLLKVENANKDHNDIESFHKLINNPPQKELTATRLGKLRLHIKKHLVAKMKEMDGLVEKVVG